MGLCLYFSNDNFEEIVTIITCNLDSEDVKGQTKFVRTIEEK